MKKIFTISLMLLLLVVLAPLSTSSVNVVDNDIGIYVQPLQDQSYVEMTYSADIQSYAFVNHVEVYSGVEKPGIVMMNDKNFQEVPASVAIMNYRTDIPESQEVPYTNNKMQDAGKDRIQNQPVREGLSRLDIGEKFSQAREMVRHI